MSKNNKLSEALRKLTGNNKELFGIKKYTPKVTQDLNETAKFAKENISKDGNKDLNESAINPLDKSFIKPNLNDQTFGPNSLNSSIKSTNSILNNAQLNISISDLNESAINPLDKSFIETPNDQTIGPHSLNSSMKSANSSLNDAQIGINISDMKSTNSSLNNAQLDNKKPSKTIKPNIWGIGTFGNEQKDQAMEEEFEKDRTELLAKLEKIKNTLINPTTRPRSKAVTTKATDSIDARPRGKAVMAKTNPSSQSR